MRLHLIKEYDNARRQRCLKQLKSSSMNSRRAPRHYQKAYSNYTMAFASAEKALVSMPGSSYRRAIDMPLRFHIAAAVITMFYYLRTDVFGILPQNANTDQLSPRRRCSIDMR